MRQTHRDKLRVEIEGGSGSEVGRSERMMMGIQLPNAVFVEACTSNETTVAAAVSSHDG